MKFSAAGILVVAIGLVAGIIIWVVGYNNLPNNVTHRDLAANPPIQTSVNQTASAGGSSTSSSGGAGTGSSGGGTAGSGSATASSGGNVQQGQVIFQQQCSVCHGSNGQGASGPPLMGSSSALSGGMTQQANLASFIKANMPLTSPGSLSQQQATDVAAYILSHK